MSRNTEILIRNGMVAVPADRPNSTPATRAQLVTVMSNAMYYGYGFALNTFNALRDCSAEQLISFSLEVESAFKALTGADLNMDNVVVYKNFPEEVLSMEEAEYWERQCKIYAGHPVEDLAEQEKTREPMREDFVLKVLRFAGDDALSGIYQGLLGLPARWTAQQLLDAEYLAETLGSTCSLSQISFKENMVSLARHMLEKGYPATVTTATDVLRLAIGMSDGDVSMRVKSKFRNFKRSERQFMLAMLEGCAQLEEDMRRDISRWKHLMRALRPGDYASKFPKVVAANDKLYNDQLPLTFNGLVEAKLLKGDASVLADLQARPGEFMRRLRVCVCKFGMSAVHMFQPVLPKLSGMQLLKLQGYLQVMPDRQFRAFPPRGNWNKLQIAEVDANYKMPEKARKDLLSSLADELADRLSGFQVNLDPRTELIKFQTNDSELSPYGRGTAFPIPENAKFIRTASYWKVPGMGTIWYDNGINFFDKNWNAIGTICWNHAHFDGAAFSGDPMSSKTVDGDACQIIDMYPERLLAQGARYAVWNILCYSGRSFDDAETVFATLQWGEKPDSGKLFEPARSQLAFPVTGKQLTKYIAYIDLVERKLVYMDANLAGQVSSATSNANTLQTTMPVFVEYLNGLPSVHDLFVHAPASENGIPVLYDDTQVELNGEEAYCFRPQNEENVFTQLDLNRFLK